MIQIEKFVVNPFQENSYVLHDETGECIIVDPGFYQEHEETELTTFIAANDLTPVRLIYTHCHVDHVLGNNFICNTYGLLPEMHLESLPFLQSIVIQARNYGFRMDTPIEPSRFIGHGDLLQFGDSELKAVYTPGHVDGHLCFINFPQKFVLTGDVLFRDSIGRTDFPTGDFDRLMDSIHEQLFTLADDFTVHCGHGPETSIGYEKVNNPFIRF